MIYYLLKRLLLIPVTLFFIILINFVIINLAPGDPTTLTDISQEGGSRNENSGTINPGEDRYLQFREFFGLTKPILFNTWPYMTFEEVNSNLKKLTFEKQTLSAKTYNELKIKMGDEARYVMPDLLEEIKDPALKPLAIKYFIRGAYRLGFVGPNISSEDRAFNDKVTTDERELSSFKEYSEFKNWYEKNKEYYHFELTSSEKIKKLFFDTRFVSYFTRVLTLNFGTLRNDSNKTVISEVVKRFKYSLTLAVTPLVITFFLSFLFGMLMAAKQKTFFDYGFNLIFLILYAIPVFVAAPFLIQKVALYHHFPFTSIPIPIEGFTSPDPIYNQMTPSQKLFDTIRHIILPITAILYGSVAAQARLTRTAFLEVMRQDFVRAAYIKGVAPFPLLFKHVGRVSSITLITSIAGSLGIVLGGSLIVETLFEINGFGKFFYDAIVNRDYNVILFSALAGSFLTLLGYLISDLAYMWLDPRITLHEA